MACKDEGKCFTFLWKLENIRYSLQKMEERIESPPFVVDAIEGTKWRLRLYPRGCEDENNIGYYLIREADSKGAEEIKLRFELAFLAKDGSVLACSNSNPNTFHKGTEIGIHDFQQLKDVYISRRSEFLPQNTLTARCRIWKSDGEMLEDVRCVVHTCIGVEKRFFQWNVKNFTTLNREKKCTYQIKSLVNKVPLMSVDLSLTGELSSEEIRFELSLKDQTIKFATLRVLLIDASNNRVECNQGEIWFDDPSSSEELTFSYSKNKLLEEKSKFLPNDTLFLLWEWAFCKGVVSQETEEDEYGCICPEVEVSDCCQETEDLMLNFDANNDKVTLFNDLVDNVKSLYYEHFLSDVKLKTSTSVFPAHKFTLSASSSVFKAMFSNDMKENISDCVNIEDFTDDTVSRMLLFIYTTRVEDLTWEGASHLYVAADKYAILSLKNICSSYLKSNLSPSNACDLLLLSDLHADGDLKSVVQDYILKNGKQITNSEEWKVFMKNNAMLAAETLCLLFK